MNTLKIDQFLKLNLTKKDAINQLQKLALLAKEPEWHPHVLSKLMDIFPEPSDSVSINTLICDLAAEIGRIDTAFIYGSTAIKQLDKIYCEQTVAVDFLKIKRPRCNEIDIFSYSLFGDSPRYIIPIIESISAINQYFNNNKIVIYYDDKVPKEYIDVFKNNGVILIKKPLSIGLTGTFWRFEAFTDFKEGHLHFRDADSVITKREAKILHSYKKINNSDGYVIRDHVQHCHCVLAGLWGSKCNPVQDIKKIFSSVGSMKNRQDDQLFLGYFLWPKFKKRITQIDRVYTNILHSVKYLNSDQIDKLQDERLHIGSDISMKISPKIWVEKRLPILNIKSNKIFEDLLNKYDTTRL